MLCNVYESWEHPEHWDNSVRNISVSLNGRDQDKDLLFPQVPLDGTFSLYVGGMHSSVSVCVFVWDCSDLQATDDVHN